MGSRQTIALNLQSLKSWQVPTHPWGFELESPVICAGALTFLLLLHKSTMHLRSSMFVGSGLTSCDELFGCGHRHRIKMDHFDLKLPWKEGGIPCIILISHVLFPPFCHTWSTLSWTNSVLCQVCYVGGQISRRWGAGLRPSLRGRGEKQSSGVGSCFQHWWALWHSRSAKLISFLQNLSETGTENKTCLVFYAEQWPSFPCTHLFLLKAWISPDAVWLLSPQDHALTGISLQFFLRTRLRPALKSGHIMTQIRSGRKLLLQNRFLDGPFSKEDRLVVLDWVKNIN